MTLGLRCEYERLLLDPIYDGPTGSRLQTGGSPGNTRHFFGFSRAEQPRESKNSIAFQSVLGALLTRYAGDKFERSQHAYRTQRAQIHIQVYVFRERRKNPAPKTHTPRHTLLLTTLLH